MSISVMTSNAVMICQRRNYFAPNIRQELSTPWHIQCAAYLLWALTRMCRHQHCFMVAINCEPDHRCKTPNGAEYKNSHANHPGFVDIESEHATDKRSN